ncbi:cytochrome P450 [Trametes versicolor FP-101664 SS1]|uniref:cytochrome P450 n=1 Tax=Trametes versicolor (strain FP-101664) TaxID=717944 RepID=UPI0004623E29|nr:cytochrome P450 [Trametes versicolor FP-101664 SS1]EIW59174.1 cytochrome P450 [Trametes versicolor FP-101664 SS1]
MAADYNVKSVPALEEIEIAKDVCAIAVEGSTDTAELDAIVGSGRLPDHSDTDNLVYVNAVLKEAPRRHAVVPVGLPHRTLGDDEVNGYFIPAGTTIIINVWSILHDPDTYEDPFVFRPERFIKDGKLDPTVQDPADYMFGFGRRHVQLSPVHCNRVVTSPDRICPGRHLAIPSLFINIVSILHVFDISLPLDRNGQPVSVKYEETHGLVRPPLRRWLDAGKFRGYSGHAQSMLNAVWLCHALSLAQCRYTYATKTYADSITFNWSSPAACRVSGSSLTLLD